MWLGVAEVKGASDPLYKKGFIRFGPSVFSMQVDLQIHLTRRDFLGSGSLILSSWAQALPLCLKLFLAGQLMSHPSRLLQRSRSGSLSCAIGCHCLVVRARPTLNGLQELSLQPLQVCSAFPERTTAQCRCAWRPGLQGCCSAPNWKISCAKCCSIKMRPDLGPQRPC